jgi:hypothetical protein
MHTDFTCKNAGDRSNRSLRREFLLAAGVMLGLWTLPLAAEQCNEECTHPTKACLCVVASSTGKVTITSLGSSEAQPALLRQALEIGDQIATAEGPALIELTCPGGSQVKFHGDLRTVIRPSAEGQDCAFDLLSGASDIQANQPTELRAGNVTMGSKSTLYGMKVWRTPDGPNMECVVFEGEAQVWTSRQQNYRSMTSNSKAAWTRGRWAGQGRITADDIEATARIYAQTDIFRLQIQNVEVSAETRSDLIKSYTGVLARANDVQSRIDLAVIQTNAGIARQAIYYLNQADRIPTVTPEQRSAIASTKVVAYTKVGRQQEAAVELERVRRLDPAEYQNLRRQDLKNLRNWQPTRPTR